MPIIDWTLHNDGLVGWSDETDSPPIDYSPIGLFTPNDFLDGGGNQRDTAINTTPCLVMASGGSPGTLKAGHAFRAHTSVRGDIQGLLKLHLIQNVPTHCGFCVLQNQASMLPGLGGISYAVILDTVFGGHLLRLVQLTNGISGSPGGALGTTYRLLAESPASAFNPGSAQLVRLAWESDPLTLKGTRLRVWHGGVLLWDIVHTGADAHVPTAPVGVGCIMQYATNNIVTYFDDITVLGVA